LTRFEDFSVVQNKVAFSRLLDELDLPQPLTKTVMSKAELLRCAEYPVYVKKAFGTASRGVWLVSNMQELEDVASLLDQQNAFSYGVLVQHVVPGVLERAQAIFNQGLLVQIHCYRQLLPGIGGGDAIKESVTRSIVAEHLGQIGQKLNWHGPLSVDYIFDESPFYIDGNPRLVEPMNASLSGVDLVQAWL